MNTGEVNCQRMHIIQLGEPDTFDPNAEPNNFAEYWAAMDTRQLKRQRAEERKYELACRDFIAAGRDFHWGLKVSLAYQGAINRELQERGRA